ncbi:hypothetical protein NQ315_009013 [Exocentrus adspersus]|uniref:Endonuclease/exonuclease/phosphatase domain-containing protein n=1 Tax=Exocentrus adspersus TaxID=1586481 RepID=A0AAV8VGY0_9CUCU|nr:hypothetical protein NQ315_009013 [Exocentrus adspersus]
MELVEWCKSNNLPLIVGCDANAHHTCWGSKDVNQRGQDLLEFLISSGLDILNRGTKPPFVTRNRQEVIDITISNSWSSHLVTNWRVSSEVSMSDHRHILFNLETGTVPEEREYRNPKLTVWSTYKDSLSRNVGPPVRPHTIPQIESSVKNLTKAVVHAYEQSCPVRKDYHMNDEVMVACLKIRDAENHWKATETVETVDKPKTKEVFYYFPIEGTVETGREYVTLGTTDVLHRCDRSCMKD